MTWRLTFSEGSTVPATAAQMSNVFTPEGYLRTTSHWPTSRYADEERGWIDRWMD